MPAPTVLDSAFNSIVGPVGSVQASLTGIQAGESIIILGAALNTASAGIFPGTISENVGDYTLVPRDSYEDTARRLAIYIWDQLDVPSTGDRTFTLTFNNNTYPLLLVLRTEACVFEDVYQGDEGPAAGAIHNHSTTGITTADDDLLVMFIGSNLTANFADIGSPYTRRSGAGTYENRYAVHHGADSLINDRISIVAGISNRNSHAMVGRYNVTAGAPLPPFQGTPTPSPIVIAEGTTGTIYDASSDWSVGSGGTPPLTFGPTTPDEFAPGFSITTTGQIQSDGNPTAGDYTLQRYQCDDAASNGPTQSNQFTITVTAAGIGILKTEPLTNGSGVRVSGRTGITAAVYPGETITATPTVVVTGLDQQPDDTIVVSDAAISAGQTYTLLIYEPDFDDAQAFHGQPQRLVAT